MGIFSDAFFNSISPFIETISYIIPSGTSKSISAIVNRKQQSNTSFRKMTSNFMIYPLEILVKKSDISTVTENKDKVSALNKKGQTKNYLVKEIVNSDHETWTLGCVEIGE